MTMLDDFIAQDPGSRDFVDLMGNTRRSENDVRVITESILQGMGYPAAVQVIIAAKVDIYTLQRLNEIAAELGLPGDQDMQLPPYVLSVAEKAEIRNYGTARALCGALKDLMWGRAQLVNAALDYEGIRDWLATLPPVEGGQPDPDADLRAQLQAQLDTADAGVVTLVASRDATREAQQP